MHQACKDAEPFSARESWSHAIKLAARTHQSSLDFGQASNLHKAGLQYANGPEGLEVTIQHENVVDQEALGEASRTRDR